MKRHGNLPVHRLVWVTLNDGRRVQMLEVVKQNV